MSRLLVSWGISSQTWISELLDSLWRYLVAPDEQPRARCTSIGSEDLIPLSSCNGRSPGISSMLLRLCWETQKTFLRLHVWMCCLEELDYLCNLSGLQRQVVTKIGIGQVVTKIGIGPKIPVSVGL
ncbi:unnamed protein product [Merluccius merluccius]